MLRLVAFDMDGTLVDVASSWRVVHDHFGDTNDEGLRRFLANEIDDEEFIRSDIRRWWTHAPVAHGLRPRTDPVERAADARAPALVHELRARGIRTAIVSGGLDLLARRIARELGIDLALANGVRRSPPRAD